MKAEGMEGFHIWFGSLFEGIVQGPHLGSISLAVAFFEQIFTFLPQYWLRKLDALECRRMYFSRRLYVCGLLSKDDIRTCCGVRKKSTNRAEQQWRHFPSSSSITGLAALPSAAFRYISGIFRWEQLLICDIRLYERVARKPASVLLECFVTCWYLIFLPRIAICKHNMKVSKSSSSLEPLG